MTEIIPTIGRIVLYTLSQSDADKIKGTRAHAQQHQHQFYGTTLDIGNEVSEGKQYPALVVAVWGDTPDCAVNLKVELDGTDCYWATSRHVGEEPGTYQWMKYQKQVAAGEIAPTLYCEGRVSPLK